MQDLFTPVSLIRKRLPGSFIKLIVLLFCAGGARAQSAADTLHIKQAGIYSINQHLYYYKNPNKIAIKEIAKLTHTKSFEKLYPANAINAGITDNYYWLLFTLKNEKATDGVFYFQLHQPWLKIAQLYCRTDTGYKLMAQSGMTLKFGERPYKYYDIVFPISLRNQSAGTFLVLVDNKGSNLNILPTLVDDDSFRVVEKKEYLFFGLLSGIMVFSIIINIFLYLSLKEKIHLIYTLYVLAMLYWMYCSLSLDFQYLYPNHPFLTTMSISISTSFSFIMMTKLITSFLNITGQNSRFKKSIDWLTYLFYILPIACFSTHYWYEGHTDLHEIYVYVFIGATICLATLYYLAIIEKLMQKVKEAWFFLVGEGFIALGILKYCFHMLGGGLNSSVQSMPNDIQIGLTVEAIIIFMGIIYRYNLYKNEKQKLQQSLLQQQLLSMREVVAAQEGERKRIAQDIHDDVGSTLGTLLLHISNVPENQEIKTRESQLHYEKSIDISRKAINDLRNISHNILPQDFTEMGIFRILENRVDELNMIGDIHFTLITEGNEKEIENLFSITIYRIINEMINNTLKHSQASMATIQLLMTSTEIIVMMEDNGIGGSTTSGTKGIGMKNIYSRTEFLNGKITIDDSPAGTSIIIEIPKENKLKNIPNEY